MTIKMIENAKIRRHSEEPTNKGFVYNLPPESVKRSWDSSLKEAAAISEFKKQQIPLPSSTRRGSNEP